MPGQLAQRMRANHIGENKCGQALVLVALALLAMVILLALVVDGGRLLAEKQQLQRGADGASQAGASMVGDLIVTRAAMRQATAMAAPPEPSPTPTPPLTDSLAWLTPEDILWLTGSSEAQGLVCTMALNYADRNRVGTANPSVSVAEAVFPYAYEAGNRSVQVRVHIVRSTDLFLPGIWNQDRTVLDVTSTSDMQILK
jgi:hypothetical protein